jgi:hypothetical protein
VDAVQCGVAVQKELQARNADLPENRRMQFRIGINLGDVIEEGERIYGDGVNIAARLEALAPPGGICVSKTTFDHIESKLPLGYEYLGEQAVIATKSVPAPISSLDGNYSGQLCNKFPNRTIWFPVTLVVSNGIVAGSWVNRLGKRATAHGTVVPEGTITLNLEGWTPRGDPVKATIIGRVVDGTITVSGRWPNGPLVSGEWKLAP